MTTGKWLGIIVTLQAIILLGQWTGSQPLLPQAMAQIPDPASRQMQMIDELRGVNAKLDRMLGLLQSGELQVRVERPDEDKGAGRAR